MVSLAALLGAGVVLVLLRLLVTHQIGVIVLLREEQEEAVRIFDIASSIEEAIGGREDILADIEGLLPNLINAGAAVRGIEDGVSNLFTRRPEVRTLGVSVHPGDATVQEIQFLITGRILETKIDMVLERLDTLPTLLEIREMKFKATGPFAEGEGEVSYSGVVFVRDQ